MIIIVRNTSLQIYNKKKKEICADDELTCISDNSDIEADTENRDSEKQLFELVKELDPKYSDVLMLRYFYDMPNREISSLLGISQNNVNIRLMRGRDMLRKKLKEESANDRFSV